MNALVGRRGTGASSSNVPASPSHNDITTVFAVIQEPPTNNSE